MPEETVEPDMPLLVRADEPETVPPGDVLVDVDKLVEIVKLDTLPTVELVVSEMVPLDVVLVGTSWLDVPLLSVVEVE